MDPKLIMVEGLPGAGKTTVAEQVMKELKGQKRKVMYFDEKSTHPVDLSWQAFLTKDEYHGFVAECLNIWMNSKQTISDDELIRRIEEQTRIDNGFVAIAYRNIDFPDDSYETVRKRLVLKMIRQGRVSFEQFRQINVGRWNAFAQDMMLEDKTVVFDASLLQNNLFEILCSYELKDEQIIDYIMELANTVTFLVPKIMYVMCPDVEKLVNRLQRKYQIEDEKEFNWFAHMEDWVSNTVFAKKHGYTGKHGIIAFLEEKQRLDYKVLERLGIPVTWVVKWA